MRTKFAIYHALGSNYTEFVQQPRKYVCSIMAESLDDAFKQSQNGIDGQNHCWCKEKPARSTSIGDVIVTSTGLAYMVMMSGFTEIAIEYVENTFNQTKQTKQHNIMANKAKEIPTVQLPNGQEVPNFANINTERPVGIVDLLTLGRLISILPSVSLDKIKENLLGGIHNAETMPQLMQVLEEEIAFHMTVNSVQTFLGVEKPARMEQSPAIH